MKARKAKDPPVEAIVTSIIPEGKHGSYAVAVPEDTTYGTITFSLNADVWHEKKLPEVADHVVLKDIRKRPAGLRAHDARFLRP